MFTAGARLSVEQVEAMTDEQLAQACRDSITAIHEQALAFGRTDATVVLLIQAEGTVPFIPEGS